MQRKTNYFAVGLIVASFLLSLSLGVDSASAASATITANTDITLNASSAGNGVTIDEESIGITTTCNKGYDLTIATSTSTDLYLNGDSTKTAAYTAVDGTSALDSTNNTNKWGYTLTNNATASTVFSPLSTTASSIRTISQTTDITSETIPIYYGIKTDNTVDPGTYAMGNNGTIVYYLTMNPLCNVVDIAYDGNNADAGTMGAQGTGVIHTGKKDGDTIDLIASNFSRDGYGFAGWSLDKDAGEKLLDNDNTNNPVVYGPQESITLPEGFTANDTDNDGIVKLYAVWLQSQGNLQGWIGCSNLDTATYDSTTGALDLTKNSVTALTDMRDHDTYAVARLADGNCWMIENLRLDADATRGNNQYNPSVTNEFLSQGYGTFDYSIFRGLANAESSNFAETTVANSLYYAGAQSGTATIDIGSSTGADSAHRMPRYNNTNTSTRAINPVANNNAMYSYGNYYTWSAATADLSSNSVNNQSTLGTSLCPAGWHLPTGGGAYSSDSTTEVNKTGSPSTFREYYYLGYEIMNEVKTAYEDTPWGNQSYYSKNTINTAGDNAGKAFRKYPNNFIQSGLIKNNSLEDRGSDGFYWSSTAYSSGNAYTLSTGSNYANPGTYYSSRYKYLGMPIRCIVSESYILTFNANGGTGAVNNQVIPRDEPTELVSAKSLVAPQGSSYVNSDNITITGESDKLWVFWGWNTEVDGTGDWYKDKEKVENIADTGTTITLYAQWKQATLADMTAGTQAGNEKVINHNLMQDMSPEICWNSTAYAISTSSPAHSPYNPSSNPGGYHTITLNDYRGKTTSEQPDRYTVSKLSDNLCWMTSDLRLGSTSKKIALTNADTDTVDDFILPIAETSSTKTQWGVLDSVDNLDTAHIYKYSSSKSVYNWYTATAGTPYTSLKATTSICPANWRLLTKAQGEGYLSAIGESPNSTNTAVLTGEPISFTSGYYNSASMTTYSNTMNWTSDGWQNASTGLYYGYFFGIGTSSNVSYLRTTYGYQKMMGIGVRCVASIGKATIHYDGNSSAQVPVTGSVASQENVDLNSTNAQTSAGLTPQVTGYTFDNWNTAPDGSGISVAANGALNLLNLKPGDSITLYAQWSPKYTITYVNNCQTYVGTNSGCTQAISDGTSKQTISLNQSGEVSTTLAAYNKWTLTGWKIKGWSIVADNSTNANTEYPVSAAYAVTGQNPGNGITLYAHWMPMYSIQYDGNGADNPNGMGTIDASTGIKSVRQTNIIEGDQIMLLASNFKRSGYGFAGWSTNPNATVSSGDRIYGPMETISAPAYNGTNITTLYAVWIPAETNGNSPVYIQDWNNCSSLTSASFNATTGEITAGSVIALTDKRDNEVYAIAKLADDNCWMIENLRLGHDGTVGQNINDPAVTNQSLSQGYGGTTGVYGNFVGLAEPEDNTRFDGNTVSNSIYKSSANPPIDTYDPLTNTLEDIGTTDGPGSRFPRYRSNNTDNMVDGITYTQSFANASAPTESGTNYRTSSNLYSLGNYYTWSAAIANTNYYSAISDSEAANTSICPSGWHLPSSGGANKESGTLAKRYGGTGGGQIKEASHDLLDRFRTFPNNVVYSGNVYTNSVINRGTVAFYWSQSVNNASFAYMLELSQNSSYPQIQPSERADKSVGFSVRCLISGQQ